MKIKVRKALKKDLPSILSLIKELAAYEQAPKEVKVTLKELGRNGFGKEKVFDCFVAECLIPPYPQSLSSGRGKRPLNINKIVGMALYYTKYSTWKGKCIYLDDIIVTESARRAGIGKKLFEAVIAVAKKMKVRKLEWQVLNWNKPAINFYKKYRTVFDNEWVNCKLVFEK
ncbi:MAG: GNAT family N-acetyltransferase [Bacteroidetes bacterium]|nr:MAG: GNAT family N-acetyltransferase [Bacteroidota bacterium]